MSSVVVLVGRRSGDPHRDRLWQWCRRRWEQQLPGVMIVEGHHGSPGSGDEEGAPFCLSKAFNRAAVNASTVSPEWDCAVLVGADWIADTAGQVHEAVRVARETGVMCFAHTSTAVLSQDVSEQLVANEVGAWIPAHPGDDGSWHQGTYSGVQAVTRELWDEVGGFDERFVGWGWDDWAFFSAAHALRGGVERVDGSIAHLWHPRDWNDREGAPTHGPNQVLGERYRAAKTDKAVMEAILREPGGPRA